MLCSVFYLIGGKCDKDPQNGKNLLVESGSLGLQLNQFGIVLGLGRLESRIHVPLTKTRI